MSISGYVDDFRVDGLWQEYMHIRKSRLPTSAKVLHDGMALRIKSHENYKDCTISDEFKDFQFFAQWCNEQIGYGNTDFAGRKWVIDKDITIKDSREYSPESCSFIPALLNLMMARKKKKWNGLPTGVTKEKSGMYSAFGTGYTGKGRPLGLFDTSKEAFDVYRKNKESVIRATAMELANSINPETFKSLMNWRVCEYENFTF